LRYLVTIGARHDEHGWRWKIDPVLRPGGFGPWRPEWSMMRMPGLAMPVLGVLGLLSEPMGWGTQQEDVEPWLPPGGELVAFEDTGHFVHIEHPKRVAELVLDFLGPPPSDRVWAPVGAGTPAPEVAPAPTKPTVTLTHGKAELALHELRAGKGRPLLLLHGLAERAPDAVPASVAAWAGPIWALDFTGHGGSTVPHGGGYTAEVLMGDADAALRHLGTATVFGRGLGAYIALLLAGARPKDVCGAILGDGPGLIGGGALPGSPATLAIDADAIAPPDPFALAELARDMRPPDYASTFARLATHGSPLEHPLAVSAVNRPEWLDAVLLEPGVVAIGLTAALELYQG
jgi:pimeloyl-ACP methyl ester carboxylesterase